MTHALALLPPVVNQTVQRVPLSPWSAAGFAVITAICVYLGVKRSPWLIAVLAFVVPFAGYRDIGQTTLTILKCAAIGSAVGLLLGGVRIWPVSSAARRVLLASGGILATIALSATAARDLGLVAREFAKQAEYIVVLWCGVACLERIERADRYFAASVATSAAIVASLALVQVLVGGAPSGVFINGHPVPRATGTLEGPNQLAGFLEAALPVLWIWPLLASIWPPLRAFIISVGCAALIVTQSRAGIIMGAVEYWLTWRMRQLAARTAAMPAAAGAAAGVALTAAWFVFWAHARWADLERFFLLDVSTAPGGVGTRAQLWPAALALAARHPIFGAGAGNFSILLPTVGVTGVATQAGSLWLQTLAEQGIAGLLALGIFAWIALRETFVLARNSALATAAFVSAVSLFAHQLVDDLFFFPKVAALFWLLLGAGTARERLTAGRKP